MTRTAYRLLNHDVPADALWARTDRSGPWSIKVTRINPDGTLNRDDFHWVRRGDLELATPTAPAIGPRSALHTTAPTRPGNGASHMWTRTIGGVLFSFTAVLMPTGERRYFVSRFNGYVGGPRFACAWTREKAITIPAPAPTPTEAPTTYPTHLEIKTWLRLGIL